MRFSPRVASKSAHLIFIFLVSSLGLLAKPNHAKVENAPVTFDIPEGSAEVTLKAFAAQSGRQVIYPTELVHRLKTRAVQGEFTIQAALDHMIGGSEFTAWEDPQSGALAIRRKTGTPPAKEVERRPPSIREERFRALIPPRLTIARSDAPDNRAPLAGTIELPPFTVEGKTSMHWRYAEAPGVEILSRCSDLTTATLFEQHYALHEMLELILPAKLRYRSDVRTTYLFFNVEDQSLVSQELLTELRKREAEVAAKQARDERTSGAEAEVVALPNYRFWDQDALSVFFVVDERAIEGQLRLTPGYVRHLLVRRAPALPRWFIEGILDLYRDSVTTAVPSRPSARALGSPFHAFNTRISPLVWLSPDVTREIISNPNRHVEMAPLAELLSDELRIAANASSAEIAVAEKLRRAEIELFIHWMLKDGQEETREKLWTLVQRASEGPITETLFKECIGMNYHAAEAELQSYLRTACREEIILRPTVIPMLGPIDFTEASLPQVSRIKGGFDRLEIGYVRDVSPGLISKYVQQARQTLRRSYERGDRDPNLLAELGLCECDANDDAAGVPFLEAAVRAQVVRPRAYYELARIRFAAAQARGAPAKLSADELYGILQPLRRAYGQRPALPEIYELMAEAWLATNIRPAPIHFAALDEGLRIFPRRTRLLLSVALLNAVNGNLGEAQRLAEAGLRYSSEPDERGRFEQLLTIVSQAGATDSIKPKASLPKR